MADDTQDQTQVNTDESKVNEVTNETNVSEDKTSDSSDTLETSDSTTSTTESNLPVEEAGQLEAPKESDESSVLSSQSSDESQTVVSESVSETDKPTTEKPETENQDVTPSDSGESKEEPEEPKEPGESKVEKTSDSSDPLVTSDSTSVDTENMPHEDETERDQSITPAPEPVKDDSGGRWYVVHTYSGHENKVAATLKQRIESEHLEKKILDVLVPMQDKIEIKGGKRLEVKEKIFPGYILVKMILDDNTWLAVRTTQGVTSFVGIGNKPTPIPESEVQTIVKFTQIQHPTFKQIFAVDDTVKIVDGPFSDFIGKVESVDEEKGKVRVLVSIFGRETPVELDFLQVQKI